jgi:hypothetical protein
MPSYTTTASPEAFFNVGTSRESFPSPWLDLASAAMPTNIKDALRWCEYVYQNNGTYSMAMERTVSYFLTSIELGAADARDSLGDDEKEKWATFFEDTLGALAVLQNMDRDRSCYGNAFASVIKPFRRLLTCPDCGSAYPLEVVADPAYAETFHYRFTDTFQFYAHCPKCKVERGRGYRGAFKVNDLPDDLESKLKVKIWPVHEMEIRHDLFSGENQYIWNIPEDYRRDIRKGNILALSKAPIPVLEAVRDNQLFMFDEDVIFHMREPTLGGLRNRGWGLSRVLTNYRDLWHVQVLRRYNEAICLDYIIPFRVLTPEARSGSGAGKGALLDPLTSMDGMELRGQVMSMLRKRRQDPAAWNFLPFPVKYQALGGEASELAPHELIAQGQEQLLNAAGTPVELYRGSLQLQTAPVSLRLFEATWHHLVHDNNSFLRWLVGQVSQLLSWEVVRATMRRVTYADDFNKQMAQLQLMMGQAISQTTGLKALGMEWKDEQRLIAEESKYQSELQSEVQEEMEQAAFGEQIAKGQPAMPGGAPQAPGQPAAAPPPGAGGAPVPAGADPSGMGGMSPVNQLLQGFGENTPVTPQDMLSAAQGLASQLLSLPETQRRSELMALKQRNAVLHSLVKSHMEQMRTQARSAGQAMMLGQQPAQMSA